MKCEICSTTESVKNYIFLNKENKDEDVKRKTDYDLCTACMLMVFMKRNKMMKQKNINTGTLEDMTLLSIIEMEIKLKEMEVEVKEPVENIVKDTDGELKEPVEITEVKMEMKNELTKLKNIVKETETKVEAKLTQLKNNEEENQNRFIRDTTELFDRIVDINSPKNIEKETKLIQKQIDVLNTESKTNYFLYKDTKKHNTIIENIHSLIDKYYQKFNRSQEYLYYSFTLANFLYKICGLTEDEYYRSTPLIKILIKKKITNSNDAAFFERNVLAGRVIDICLKNGITITALTKNFRIYHFINILIDVRRENLFGKEFEEKILQEIVKKCDILDVPEKLRYFLKSNDREKLKSDLRQRFQEKTKLKQAKLVELSPDEKVEGSEEYTEKEKKIITKYLLNCINELKN